MTMATSQTNILESERLLFRRFILDDLDALSALYSDKEIRQYFPNGADGTLTREETKEVIERFLNGHPDHPELGLWATIHKETNQLIGRCGLLPQTIDERVEVEISYLLDKKYWRQGLGTEAAQAMPKSGLEQLHLSP